MAYPSRQRRVRVVVQARMGSRRFPGKIAAALAGLPLLGWTVNRLEQALSDLSHEVLVATSTASLDDHTVRLCESLGVPCFRGPENDVLRRYLLACEDLADEDTLLRATADNPWYCPRRTPALLDLHDGYHVDYSCIAQLSYVVPEMIRVGALRRMAPTTDDPYCREHVTPAFRDANSPFASLVVPPSWRGLQPAIRLTVDTPAELAFLSGLARGVNSYAELPSLETLYSRARSGAS